MRAHATLDASAAQSLAVALATTRRGRSLIFGALCLALIACVTIAAPLLGDLGVQTDFSIRSQAPSLAHGFGTDPLGRDVLARAVKGLALSLQIGVLAATLSAGIALTTALLAVFGGRAAETGVRFVVDVALGVPHLVMLILITFALGGGRNAVIIAVAATHWPRLSRVLRAELLQVVNSDYVRLSRRFGRSWSYVARRHVLAHLAPQLMIGTLLLFPHAVLHEAALTFLGFGLEPNTPAIGVMLAESMRYLTVGQWWLGFCPGLALLTLVLAFDGAANGVRALISPRESQD